MVRPCTISVSPNISASMPQSLPQPCTSFETYTTQAAIWGKQLFAKLEFLQLEQHVWSTINQNSCVCASDGSAPTNQGSFAWVVSTQHCAQLVRCSGPAFGHNISSYHAESYGIQSLLRFLHMMHQIYAAPPRCVARTHLIDCNNEGLVTTLTQVLA